MKATIIQKQVGTKITYGVKFSPTKKAFERLLNYLKGESVEIEINDGLLWPRYKTKPVNVYSVYFPQAQELDAVSRLCDFLNTGKLI